MGLFSFLSPKPATSTSRSENLNRGVITDTYSPQMKQGVQSTNFLADLLGVSQPGMSKIGGGLNTIASAGGAQAGYDSYLANAGYENVLQRMMRGTTGSQAASGLLRSGATQNALLTRGAEINQGFFNNYLQQLSNLSGLGLNAGGLVANAGQVSQSSGTGSKSSPLGSIASTIGGLASIFSDRRLKTDIRKIGTTKKGLPIYQYRYKAGGPPQIGVMAQDVKKKQPSALGPVIDGFMTVQPEKVA